VDNSKSTSVRLSFFFDAEAQLLAMLNRPQTLLNFETLQNLHAY